MRFLVDANLSPRTGSADHLTPDQQAALLVANIPTVVGEPALGAVVSLSVEQSMEHLRVRRLPI